MKRLWRQLDFHFVSYISNGRDRRNVVRSSRPHAVCTPPCEPRFEFRYQIGTQTVPRKRTSPYPPQPPPTTPPPPGASGVHLPQQRIRHQHALARAVQRYGGWVGWTGWAVWSICTVDQFICNLGIQAGPACWAVSAWLSCPLDPVIYTKSDSRLNPRNHPWRCRGRRRHCGSGARVRDEGDTGGRGRCPRRVPGGAWRLAVGWGLAPAVVLGHRACGSQRKGAVAGLWRGRVRAVPNTNCQPPNNLLPRSRRRARWH